MQKKIILKEIFGFSNFRNGQEKIIDSVSGFENVLAIMPTGAGKSLCYQLPALLREGTSLIISPLIALMRDQVRSLAQVGVTAAALHSHNTDEENETMLENVRMGRLKMLYVAPERLASRSFINLVKRLNVTFIAVDEAHCVSQWGHDFRPDYLKIGLLRNTLGDIQIAAFTATADPNTQQDILNSLFIKKPKIFLNGFDRPNIRLTCKLKQRPRQQLIEFVRGYNDQSGIIYCASRAKTEVLAQALNDNGFKSKFYHAGMSSEERRHVENCFQIDDGLIVCATVAFGMGIDKPDIRFVVHADLPKSIESFYQEIGRSGRDGLPAESLLLYNLDDVKFRRMQIDESLGSVEKKIIDHGRLNSLLGFVEAQNCRRSKILEYFEKRSFSSCLNCDICSEAPKVFDATDTVRKALSVILRTKESFGSSHLIDILRGKTSQKVKRLSHDKIPTFGLGSDFSKEQWQAIFLQLLGLDYIRPSPERLGAFYLTKKSLPVLRGQEEITLKLIDSIKYLRGNRFNKSRELVLEEDEPLYSFLRQKRKEIAQSLDVPSYIVFSDKTLIEMVDRKPRSLDEMHSISGVGQKKLSKFGNQFLEIINGNVSLKTDRNRIKIAGHSNAWLYDKIVEVINKHNRGVTGLDKPLHVSPSLILKIFERKPKKLSDLKKISGMTSGILRRYGKPLIRAMSYER